MLKEKKNLSYDSRCSKDLSSKGLPHLPYDCGFVICDRHLWSYATIIEIKNCNLHYFLLHPTQSTGQLKKFKISNFLPEMTLGKSYRHSWQNKIAETAEIKN